MTIEMHFLSLDSTFYKQSRKNSYFKMFCRSSGVSVTFVKLQTGIKMKKLFSIFQAKTFFNLAKFHTLALSFFFCLGSTALSEWGEALRNSFATRAGKTI